MSNDSTERLGEFLVRIGAMNEEQVQQVLERQKSEPDKPFRVIAIDMGFVNDEAIDRYLSGREDA